MRNRQTTSRGGALIEFSLLTVVWVPLLLGTLWIGTSMIREQQVTQVARDLSSMFSRGVDFSTTTGQANTILADITAPLGTVTSTGTGVVIFSTITYAGNSVCAMAGSTYGNANPYPPGTHTGACTNYGNFVFTQRYEQGNTSLRQSNFGNPLTADLDAANSYKIDSPVTYVTHTGDVATFSLLPAPLEEGSDGYQSGGPVYLVEVYFSGVAQPGYNGGIYAYAIF